MDFSTRASWRLLSEEEVVTILGRGAVCVCGVQRSEREGYFLGKVPDSSALALIDSDGSKDDIRASFRVNGDCITIRESDTLETIGRLSDEIIKCRQPVLVDLTSNLVPELFMLLLQMKKKQYDNIYAVHVEPMKYQVVNENGLMEHHKFNKRVSAMFGIPGFIHHLRGGSRESLYAFLGFEGTRFHEVVEYFNKEYDMTVILPMPSYRGGFHNHVLSGNYPDLISNDPVRDRKVERISADNPFHVLEFLERSYRERRGSARFVLAPIGTKPHALGAALFALRHDDVKIIYDYPVPDDSQTTGVNAMLGYALGGLIFE
ncbi:MAG: hypothetical protein ACYCOU_11565 [Sulfobacillus sp.]